MHEWEAYNIPPENNVEGKGTNRAELVKCLQTTQLNPSGGLGLVGSQTACPALYLDSWIRKTFWPHKWKSLVCSPNGLAGEGWICLMFWHWTAAALRTAQWQPRLWHPPQTQPRGWTAQGQQLRALKLHMAHNAASQLLPHRCCSPATVAVTDGQERHWTPCCLGATHPTGPTQTCSSPELCFPVRTSIRAPSTVGSSLVALGPLSGLGSLCCAPVAPKMGHLELGPVRFFKDVKDSSGSKHFHFSAV